MKKLAHWSKEHPTKARIIIAMNHIALIILGITFGIGSYLYDFHISATFLAIILIVFILAYLFYPKRGEHHGIFAYSWNRRVKHDIILVLSSTCVLAAGVNQFAFQSPEFRQPMPEVRLMVIKPGGDTEIQTKKEIRKGLITQIKAYKAEIKTQLKSLKSEWRESENNTAVKIALIFLVVVFAAAAGYGIGVLSCNLSCSGQEGLAVLVAFGGGIAILFLGFLAIRGILRMGKK
jgi:hypothetical protein